MKSYRRLIGGIACLLLGCFGAAAQKPRLEVSQQMNLTTAPAVAEFNLLVKKAERKLYVYRVERGQSKLFKSYTIALGNHPTGHKKQQGDGATPEGEYYITHRNPQSNYYLSLGLSYPNAPDAAAGLQYGLLTQAQHDAIVTASGQQAKPPQNTRLGGDIFIHGGGTGSDWTRGCVALENEAIKELFELLPVKTPVKIVP